MFQDTYELMIWLVIRLWINYRGYCKDSLFIVHRLKHKAGTGPLSPGMKARVKADQSLCLTVVTTKMQGQVRFAGKENEGKADQSLREARQIDPWRGAIQGLV